MATEKKKTTTRKRAVKTKAPSKAEIIVSGVTTMHDEALELAESVLFMAAKLEESRKQMEHEPLVVPYDNGGGQSGIRENPHFSAFEKLVKTYTHSLAQLNTIVSNGKQTEKSLGVMAELSTIAGRRIG